MQGKIKIIAIALLLICAMASCIGQRCKCPKIAANNATQQTKT